MKRNKVKVLKLFLHVMSTIFIKMVSGNTSTMNKTKAMYILGDSSVDCGENTLFFPFLLNNISLHPCDGSPSSSLLPYLIARKIELPYSVPFYSQNGTTEVLLRGVNLGSTGATIISTTNPTLQSLNQQLRQAFEIFQILQLQLSQETANGFIQSSTLFYLSFGKDDYINLFRSNTAKGPGPNAEKLSHILVDQMTNAIEYLYGSSVRKFVLMGILPLGCAPRFLQRSNGSMSGGGRDEGRNWVVCADEINNHVLEYNAFLERRIVTLNAKLAGAKLIFCDVYSAMIEIISNPKAYGFQNVKSACCGLSLRGGITGCMSMSMVCEEPSTYVWWDQFNPGHVVNSFIADSAWSGQPLPDICRPTSVQELLSS